MSIQRILSALFAGLNGLMLVAFVLSVVVQYNDPDPFGWMVVYGAAAVSCALYVRKGLPWMVPAAVALAAFGWMAFLAPRVAGRVAPGGLFESKSMSDTGVEIAREAGGLLLVGVWMTVLALVTGGKAWRRRTPKP